MFDFERATMANPAGESTGEILKLDFDRKLIHQFRGAVVSSDAGLLAYRAFDDVLGLTAMAGESLLDARTGRNGRHALIGMLRQCLRPSRAEGGAHNAASGLDAFR
jgi:hypothetical protein